MLTYDAAFHFPSEGLVLTSVFNGDGTTSAIVVPLDEPPLNLDLKGNLPVSVIPSSAGLDTGGSVSMSLGADRKSVSYSFSPALLNDGRLHSVNVTLLFAGQ